MEKAQFDFDEKLIQEVRRHSLIYNPALEDYKSLRKKERAWQAVSRRVNLNVTLCRKRWKGLRDCYMRCKRTIPAGVKQKWKYYQSMSFLDKIPSFRRSVWNIPQNDSDDKGAEDKRIDQSMEDESAMQAVEDESDIKTLDDYFDHETGVNMEFIATEDYALPNVESPLLLELENKEVTFEEQLIEEVRQQTCLYDPYSQDYSNNKVKERVWVEIAKRLNSSDGVCMNLWKTLRDTYRRTLERSKSRRAGPIGRKKRWKYFEKLNFLDDYTENRSIIETTGIINKAEDADEYFDAAVPEERTLNSDDLETPAGFSQSLDPLDHSTSSECSTTGGRKRKQNSLQSKQKDSTTLLFESLNQNIKDAKLSAKQRLDMESSIASLVYAKLLTYSN